MKNEKHIPLVLFLLTSCITLCLLALLFFSPLITHAFWSWTGPSDNETIANIAETKFDTIGNTYSIFADITSLNLYFQYRMVVSGWESPEILSDSGEYFFGKAIALDTSNQPHVVATTASSLTYWAKIAGTWSQTAITPQGAPYGVDVAIDSNGFAHICYLDSDNKRLYYTTNMSGSFSVPTALTSLPFETYPSVNGINIEFDSNDTLHVVFVGRTGSSGDYYLFYLYNNGSWSERTQISTQPTAARIGLAVDSNNKLHTTFHRVSEGFSQDLGYLTNRADSWQEELITTATNTNHVDIATDATNQAHISYYNDDDSQKMYHAFGSFGSWQTETISTTGCTYTSIGADNNNLLHATCILNTNNHLAYFQGEEIPPTATPTITETFTPTMTPTITDTITITPTRSETTTYTHTPTETKTSSITDTPLLTLTPTLSPTYTISVTVSLTITATIPTHTATASATTTITYTTSFTPTITHTPTISHTSTITYTPSTSETPVDTDIPSLTPSITPTFPYGGKHVVALSKTILYTLDNQTFIIMGNSGSCFPDDQQYFVYLDTLFAKKVIPSGWTLDVTFDLAYAEPGTKKLTIEPEYGGYPIAIDLEQTTDEITIQAIPPTTKPLEALWLVQDQGTWGKYNAFVTYPGEAFDLDIDFKNVGFTEWTKENTGLYVYKDPLHSTPLEYNNPTNLQFGQSIFANSLWQTSYDGETPNAQGGILLENSVSYNEIGTFRLHIAIPANLAENQLVDAEQTTYDDQFYREDLTVAYQETWLDNTINGDTQQRAHIWLPIRVINPLLDKNKNLFRIDILSHDLISASYLKQTLTQHGYSISHIDTFQPIMQPSIYYKAKAEQVAEDIQVQVENFLEHGTILEQNNSLQEGDIVIVF